MGAWPAELAQEDAAQARERVRSLVDAIMLIPEDGRLRIEIHGELGAILSLADWARKPQGAGNVADALPQQMTDPRHR
jgi:hypothetical protein